MRACRPLVGSSYSLTAYPQWCPFGPFSSRNRSSRRPGCSTASCIAPCSWCSRSGPMPNSMRAAALPARGLALTRYAAPFHAPPVYTRCPPRRLEIVCGRVWGSGTVSGSACTVHAHNAAQALRRCPRCRHAAHGLPSMGPGSLTRATIPAPQGLGKSEAKAVAVANGNVYVSFHSHGVAHFAVCHRGLEPLTSRQGPRQVYYSHV